MNTDLSKEWISRAEDLYHEKGDDVGSSIIHRASIKIFLMCMISIALTLQDIRYELFESNYQDN